MAKTYPFTLDPFQNVSVACIVRPLPPEPLAQAACCTRRWASGGVWRLGSGVRVLASGCGLASTGSCVSDAAICVCKAASLHGIVHTCPRQILP